MAKNIHFFINQVDWFISEDSHSNGFLPASPITNFFAFHLIVTYIEELPVTASDFANAWNNKNKDKPINYAGSLTKKDKNVFQIMIDFGVDNSLKTVSLLLKEISGNVEPDLINKVLVK